MKAGGFLILLFLLICFLWGITHFMTHITASGQLAWARV